MAVGDKYFFIGDRSVAVESQPIAVGDRVICMKYNGGLIHPRVPLVGDSVMITQIKSGKVVFCSLKEDDSVFVISEWRRNATHQNEIVGLGSFDFNWGGNGNVYLSSVAGTPTDMWADDAVKVTTSLGSLSFKAGGVAIYVGLANITSICQQGDNSIQIKIYDIHGTLIGSSDIFIMAA